MQKWKTGNRPNMVMITFVAESLANFPEIVHILFKLFYVLCFSLFSNVWSSKNKKYGLNKFCFCARQLWESVF